MRRHDIARGQPDACQTSARRSFTCRRHVSALGPVQTRLHDPPCGSRMSVEMSSGSDGSALEVTATVRALATEAHLDAPRAPGALEGADHRLRRLGRKVDVAAFAARTQLQHAASLPANRLTRNKRLVARGGILPITVVSASPYADRPNARAQRRLRTAGRPCFRASPCTAWPIDKAPPASRHERTAA